MDATSLRVIVCRVVLMGTGGGRRTSAGNLQNVEGFILLVVISLPTLYA